MPCSCSIRSCCVRSSRWSRPFASIPLTLPVILLALAIVIGASVALHLPVELPLTHRLRRKSGLPPSVADQAEAAAGGEGLRQPRA